jgi:hypothetical protein
VNTYTRTNTEKITPSPRRKVEALKPPVNAAQAVLRPASHTAVRNAAQLLVAAAPLAANGQTNVRLDRSMLPIAEP